MKGNPLVSSWEEKRDEVPIERQSEYNRRLYWLLRAEIRNLRKLEKSAPDPSERVVLLHTILLVGMCARRLERPIYGPCMRRAVEVLGDVFNDRYFEMAFKYTLKVFNDMCRRVRQDIQQRGAA